MKKILIGLLLLIVCVSSFAFASHDPTRPPSREVIDQSGLFHDGFHITGIFSANHRQWAIVNGELKTVGETAGDMIITKIKDNKVYLQGIDGIQVSDFSVPDVRNTDNGSTQ